jgi:hypothetical protein
LFPTQPYRIKGKASKTEIFNLHSNRRQPRDSEMSERKMVSRSLAIALGIICIVLIAGLFGAMAYYAMNTIINTTYNDYVSTHGHTDSDYDSLNSQNTILNNIVNLNSSTVWVNDQTITQAAGNYTSWEFSAANAGFVLINIEHPTIDNITYIRVINNVDLLLGSSDEYLGPIHAYKHDNQINALPGYSFDYAFPVLPNTYEYHFVMPQEIPDLEIRIGNTKTVGNATLTVTITYWY